MQWRRKKINYEILIPNLDKSIYQLNQSEAEAYYRWFIEKIPARVAYLSQVCARQSHISIENMDLSPESLIILWKWFRKRAKIEPVIKEEKTDETKGRSKRMWSNERQLTLETEYILRDIGMYVGETFRKNNLQIYWSYYTNPNRDFFVNHPLLMGFVDRTSGQPVNVVFEPIHMVGVQASKLLDRSSKPEDLYKLYCWWAEKK